jgi:hypothetical protein
MSTDRFSATYNGINCIHQMKLSHYIFHIYEFWPAAAHTHITKVTHHIHNINKRQLSHKDSTNNDTSHQLAEVTFNMYGNEPQNEIPLSQSRGALHCSLLHTYICFSVRLPCISLSLSVSPLLWLFCFLLGLSGSGLSGEGKTEK